MKTKNKLLILANSFFLSFSLFLTGFVFITQIKNIVAFLIGSVMCGLGVFNFVGVFQSVKRL